MTALPAAHLWTAGDTPDAPAFNDVSSAMRFLLGPPEAYVWQTTSGAQAITTATFTAASFNAERLDRDTMWTSGAPTRLTIITAGWYEVEYGVFWDTVADNTWRVSALRPNGVTAQQVAQDVRANGSSDFMQRSSHDLFLNASDYLELMVMHARGSSLSTKVGTLAGDHTFLHARWTSL